MSEETRPSMLERETRVLIPVELPGDVELGAPLVRMLERTRVVVLGCYIVPEQTSPEHARSQFEESGQTAIDAAVDTLEAGDVEAVTELVFTPDPVQTIDRVSENLQIDAILWPAAIETLDEVLASVSPGVDYDRFVKSTAATVQSGHPRVTLVEFVDNEAQENERNLALDGLVSRLVDAGIEKAQIETDARVTSSRIDDLEELAADYDMIVLAYTSEMANRGFVDDVRRRVNTPVMIVRAGG